MKYKLKAFFLLLLLSFPFIAGDYAYSRQLSEPLVGAAGAAGNIEPVFSEIYKGRFDLAEKLLDRGDANVPDSDILAEVKDIISGYESIEDRRDRARVAAYTEQIAELEKIRTEAEVNEPNDISEVFSVILKVHEFADEQQKKELFDNPFVKRMIHKAENNAARFEARGRWLDALIDGYSWLDALYRDSKKYTPDRERLTEKLLIKSALQDSPCESCLDRYEGIEPGMFTRALDVLSQNYVGIIDYAEMAKKAVKRGLLLAEVLRFADVNAPAELASVPESNHGESVLPQTDLQPMETFKPIAFEFNREKIPAFSQALNRLKDNVENTPTGISKDKFISIFKKVLAANEETIQMPREIMIAQFAEASLATLDPHTVLIWPWRTRDFEKSMTNEFTGVGIEISKKDGLLKAVSLLPGTPAYYSGLDAGDIIVAVDGEKTKDMTIQCAVSKITGPAGTKVKLTVRSEDQDKTRDLIITRARIIVPTIRGWQRTDQGRWRYMIDTERKIGYVRITNFSGTTSRDFEKTVGEMEKQALAALIIDLRYNSGGYLQSAAQIADMFIDKGLIVESKPRFGYRTREQARKKGTHPNYPLIILQNSGSASASEIVAGALADHHRAILVGSRTYGKGTVQTITDYPGKGAQLKYTMAHYLLPGGEKVKSRNEMEKLGRKDWGIAPDVKIKLRSDEVKEMFDIQKENDILFSADHDSNGSEAKKYTLEETLKADSQLAVAVLIARAKLVEEKYKKTVPPETGL
ncbi:MAG: PDZ domain-containing protein [Planctomycetes bacterium]|nr:PDZ domain-containing protein [Planctomycetota bacterium]